MTKTRWGILSTSKFALNTIIPAMKQCKFAEIVAISSRDPRKAQDTAKAHDIPKSYGSYEELIGDPEIDVIYNPLPNHMHVPWSIKAIEAGKHVLCEKPIGLDVSEAVTLLETAEKYPKLKVMEAFMYRHHPQWRRAKDLVKEGKIGELRTIQSFFSYFNTDGNNIRNKAEIGGGGLMDIGCYSVSLSRFIFDAEPQRVIGCIDYDPVFKTDRMATGILDFGTGTSAFTSSTQLSPFQRVNIFGTEGRIEIEIPFNPPPDKPCKIRLQKGAVIDEITFDICNQYTIQGDLFSRSVIDDTPVPTPLDDAVNNMIVIEALFESGEND